MTLAARAQTRCASSERLRFTGQHELPTAFERAVNRGCVAFRGRRSILCSGRHNPADNLQKADPVFLRLPNARGRAVQSTRSLSEVQNEVGEETGATTSDSGQMKADKDENRIKRIVISITSRLLAAFIALSFLAMLLPAGAGAAQSIMACCRGKSASHCHAGLKPARTTSLGNACRSDCCTCCAPAQQTKRERFTAQPIVKLASPVVARSFAVDFDTFAVTHRGWVPVSPRGPPTFFIA
jgi:hypothetical protein